MKRIDKIKKILSIEIEPPSDFYSVYWYQSACIPKRQIENIDAIIPALEGFKAGLIRQIDKAIKELEGL